MLKCSENLLRLLAKEFTFHWVYLQSPLRLPLVFLLVTFLWGCSVPSLVWRFPQQQGLNHFLGSFRISVLLCLPHSSLCTCLFSIICPFVPISLFSVFFREQTISENMLCYLPCISLFPFHWQKPHGCLLVTSLTGSRLFCVTAAAVQGAARRKKEGKSVLSSWQVFCWLASLCHNLRATTFPSDLTSESALDAFS